MADSLQRQSSVESQSTDCIPSQNDDKKCATIDDTHSHSEDESYTCDIDEETLQMMMLMHLLEKEEEFEYIPEIKCSSTATNGLLSVYITNLDKLIANGAFNHPLDRIFQLVYRNSWYKQNEFSTAKIVIANMNNSNNFQIKLPIRLFEYQFEFAVRAINVNTNKWLQLCPFKTINIPSMLCDTAFKVGDKVLFRVENSINGQRGIIKELLPNNKYKIGYFQYDESKGLRDDDAAWIEVIYIVDKSRVFRLGVNQTQQIDLTDIEDIENQMLLKTNNENNIGVFRSLMHVYKSECFDYCIQMYDFKCIIYYRPMAQFISKNIYDFLFIKQDCFEYKVNCLINPYTDGTLVLNHLREYTIRRFYGYERDDDDNINDIIDHMEVSYQCDMCYGGINQFEYVFNCSHCNAVEKHDLCLNCVYNVIKLGTELEIYLREILKNQLNDDCVCEIVDYTVGRPIWY